jgi:hypothetical protein
MKTLMLIGILFISSYGVHAKNDTSCRYRNLMEDNWNKLRNLVRTTARWIDMPAYDQGRTGTCYSFAATQLVDYWRQTRGTRIDEEIMLASPIHMAMVYSSYMGRKGSLDGGLIFEAIQSLQKYGLCSQEVVNRDIRKYLSAEVGELYTDWKRRGAKVQDDAVFAELTEGFIVQQTGENGGDGNYNRLDPHLVTFNEYYAWAKDYDRRETIRMLSKKTLRKVYNKMMPYIKNNNYVGFLNKVLKSCRRKKHHVKFLDTMPRVRRFDVGEYKYAKQKRRFKNRKHYNRWRRNTYRDMIRGLLNRKNAPAIGISYCSYMLDYPGESALDSSGRPINSNDINCGGHASIIVGKKEMDGHCMYLLKNTWNSQDVCKRQDYGCLYRDVTDPDTGKKYKEEVGTWVYEEDLLDNLWFLSYIYPNKRSEKRIEAYWKRVEEKYTQATEAFLDLHDKVKRKRRKKNKWRR